MTRADDFEFENCCGLRLQDECGTNARDYVKRHRTCAKAHGRRVVLRMCYPALTILAHIPCECSCHFFQHLLSRRHGTSASRDQGSDRKHSTRGTQVLRASSFTDFQMFHIWKIWKSAHVVFQIPAMSGNRSKRIPPSYLDPVSFIVASTMTFTPDSTLSQSVCIRSSWFDWDVRNQRDVFVCKDPCSSSRKFFPSAGQGMIHPVQILQSSVTEVSTKFFHSVTNGSLVTIIFFSFLLMFFFSVCRPVQELRIFRGSVEFPRHGVHLECAFFHLLLYPKILFFSSVSDLIHPIGLRMIFLRRHLSVSALHCAA